MRKLILSVLEDMSDGPPNIGLRSVHFRNALANKLMKAIKDRGWYLNLNTIPSPEDKEK
jgi:hypothetical protein